MTFMKLSDAQMVSRGHDRMIHVRIVGHDGIFQIYPGGRTIRWPETPRYIKRLTTENELTRRTDG